jgi:hypothetical protein
MIGDLQTQKATLHLSQRRPRLRWLPLARSRGRAENCRFWRLWERHCRQPRDASCTYAGR